MGSDNENRWAHAAGVLLRSPALSYSRFISKDGHWQNFRVAATLIFWPLQLCPLRVSRPDPLFQPGQVPPTGLGPHRVRIFAAEETGLRDIRHIGFGCHCDDQLAPVRKTVPQAQTVFPLPVSRTPIDASRVRESGANLLAAARPKRVAKLVDERRVTYRATRRRHDQQL